MLFGACLLFLDFRILESKLSKHVCRERKTWSEPHKNSAICFPFAEFWGWTPSSQPSDIALVCYVKLFALTMRDWPTRTYNAFPLSSSFPFRLGLRSNTRSGILKAEDWGMGERTTQYECLSWTKKGKGQPKCPAHSSDGFCAVSITEKSNFLFCQLYNGFWGWHIRGCGRALECGAWFDRELLSVEREAFFAFIRFAMFNFRFVSFFYCFLSLPFKLIFRSFRKEIKRENREHINITKAFYCLLSFHRQRTTSKWTNKWRSRVWGRRSAWRGLTFVLSFSLLSRVKKTLYFCIMSSSWMILFLPYRYMADRDMFELRGGERTNERDFALRITQHAIVRHFPLTLLFNRQIRQSKGPLDKQQQRKFFLFTCLHDVDGWFHVSPLIMSPKNDFIHVYRSESLFHLQGSLKNVLSRHFVEVKEVSTDI